jgi:DNA replication protein DnaC
MIQQTLDGLVKLRLYGMVQALQEQMERGLASDVNLSFEERFSMLVDRELLRRQDKGIARRIKEAVFKEAARLEDVDYRHPRGLNRRLVQDLTSCHWVASRRNLVITGATGLGKTWLACAFGDRACREGFTVLYKRVSRLVHELEVARGDGSYLRLLSQLARKDLLILDDWGLSPLHGQAQHDLLEVVDDRIGLRSTLVASQLPVARWHDLMGDATVADALLDRLLHPATLITLKGAESMRNPGPRKSTSKTSSGADDVETDPDEGNCNP